MYVYIYICMYTPICVNVYIIYIIYIIYIVITHVL